MWSRMRSSQSSCSAVKVRPAFSCCRSHALVPLAHLIGVRHEFVFLVEGDADEGDEVGEDALA